MQPHNVFARIINLDDRKDRWSMMQAYVKASRFAFERFPAVRIQRIEDAWRILSLRARADINRERVQHEAISGLGAVGCAISHFGVWTEFLQSSAELCLVLEDDLNPSQAEELDPSFDLLVRRGGWDIALLGWCSTLPSRHLDGSLRVFPETKGYAGAQAYILTRKAAQCLTEHLFPLEMQVDFAMQAIAQEHGLRIVPSSLRKIRQKYTGSDVFRICVLCEPGLVYACAGVLVILVLVLAWSHFRQNSFISR